MTRALALAFREGLRNWGALVGLAIIGTATVLIAQFVAYLLVGLVVPILPGLIATGLAASWVAALATSAYRQVSGNLGDSP